MLRFLVQLVIITNLKLRLVATFLYTVMATSFVQTVSFLSVYFDTCNSVNFVNTTFYFELVIYC
jgi:hypothetical protein